MSLNQLDCLLRELSANKTLCLRLMEASDLHHAADIARSAGYEVTWHDWLRYQASKAMSLSDEQMADYCKRLSNGAEIFPHGTFFPVLGLLCREGAFEWVIPFAVAD